MILPGSPADGRRAVSALAAAAFLLQLVLVPLHLGSEEHYGVPHGAREHVHSSASGGGLEAAHDHDHDHEGAPHEPHDAFDHETGAPLPRLLPALVAVPAAVLPAARRPDDGARLPAIEPGAPNAHSLVLASHPPRASPHLTRA